MATNSNNLTIWKIGDINPDGSFTVTMGLTTEENAAIQASIENILGNKDFEGDGSIVKPIIEDIYYNWTYDDLVAFLDTAAFISYVDPTKPSKWGTTQETLGNGLFLGEIYNKRYYETTNFIFKIPTTNNFDHVVSYPEQLPPE